MGLRIVSRKDINDAKWDACIAGSLVGLPYAFTWYLDAVADKWRAIVFKDYEAVFPFPVASKMGVEYVYQPFFCQQLGLYSANTHLGLEDICLRMISKKYLYCNINLNYLSSLEINNKFSARKNYILPLNLPYEDISKKYSQSQSRNIGKAKQASLIVDFNAKNTGEFSELFEQYSTTSIEAYKSKYTKVLANLAGQVLQHNAGELCMVKHPSGAIAAMNLMLFAGKRIINIAPVTTEAGRNCGAMHYLLDSYIRRFAETDKILDFEGSSLPSVAKFYERFGATSEFFYTHKYHVFQPVTQLLRFT
jgi:hypothetical protein